MPRSPPNPKVLVLIRCYHVTPNAPSMLLWTERPKAKVPMSPDCQQKAVGRHAAPAVCLVCCMPPALRHRYRYHRHQPAATWHWMSSCSSVTAAATAAQPAVQASTGSSQCPSPTAESTSQPPAPTAGQHHTPQARGKSGHAFA